MAFRIKKAKVNRKFLYTLVKVQQERINQAHEHMAKMKDAMTKQAEEFAQTLEDLKPITQERDMLRNIIKALVSEPKDPNVISFSTTPDPNSWAVGNPPPVSYGAPAVAGEHL